MSGKADKVYIGLTFPLGKERPHDNNKNIANLYGIQSVSEGQMECPTLIMGEDKL